MNVSSSFSNFGAFLFLLLGFLVLTMTVDDALAKDDKKAGKDGDKAKVPGLDVPSIVSDIVGSRRTVLLFASYSTRLLVIVSASDQASLTSDSVVFDQPSSSLTDSLTLTSGQLLKDKWPKLTPIAGPLAVLCDSNCYLAIANSGKLTLLNLATKEVVSGQPIKDNYGSFFDKNILLSSSGTKKIYSIYQDTNVQMLEGKFTGGTDLTTFTDIGDQAADYLCNSAQGQFIWNALQCDSGKSLSWKITAGCVTSSSVFLIDKTSSSIIKFADSALTSKQKTSFTTIKFASFWVTPTTTTIATTVTIRTSTKSHSSIWLIIGVSLTVLLIVACITGVLIYFFCCKKSKKGDPKKDASLKSTSQVKSKVGSSAGVGDGTKIAKKYSTAGTATVYVGADGVVASPGATKESTPLPKLAFTMAKSSDVMGAPKSTPKGIILKGRKASKGSRKRFEGKGATGQGQSKNRFAHMPEKKASGGKLTRQGTSKRRLPSPK